MKKLTLLLVGFLLTLNLFSQDFDEDFGTGLKFDENMYETVP